MKRALIIIPVHLESRRLPRKALLEYKHKPLLRWTYDRIVRGFDKQDVIALTSDDEVSNYLSTTTMNYAFPPKVDTPTGTHRIAKYVHDSTFQNIAGSAVNPNDYDWFVNWQVDEPLVDPDDVKLLLEDPHPDDIGTLVTSISSSERNDSNVVKAAWLPDGMCVWFTRAPIVTKYGHIGVYVYHRKALEYFYLMGRQQTPYAFNERLEQLNWIERSPQFNVVARLTDNRPLSINTEKDWYEFRRMVDEELVE